jgi:anaerobic ribonucleoside-triphosphate reductase activating protein
MKWQLNKIQYPIYNLGEGKRIGIWVQGCTLGCKSCINQTLWKNNGGTAINIPDIFNWLIQIQADFDGITVSGGEPFQQYPQLIAFLHLIKTKTSLSVHCFTGYYLDELYSLFPDKLFLRYIDTLVDGRYIEEKHDDNHIRGSLNQTIYSIKEGVPVKNNYLMPSAKWSLKVSENNDIYMAGIPRSNELKCISSELKPKGFDIKFK